MADFRSVLHLTEPGDDSGCDQALSAEIPQTDNRKTKVRPGFRGEILVRFAGEHPFPVRTNRTAPARRDHVDQYQSYLHFRFSLCSLSEDPVLHNLFYTL